MSQVFIYCVCALTFVATILVFVQSLFVFVEIVASLFPAARDRAAGASARPTVCVVIPAHDEIRLIGQTVTSILAQLSRGDRLLVVADNCSDDTAGLARRAGAEVIERNDRTRIGKAYALDHAVKFIRETDFPDIVVFVDADCQFSPGGIDRLARTSANTGRPAQAAYLMVAPPSAGRNLRIAEFAWRAKNLARPLGADNLDLPVQLTGAGMAMPWSILRTAELASGHIAEDVKIGVDFAVRGYPPVFCPATRVTSSFAESARGVRDQRTRWEHGHLANMRECVPRLAIAAWKLKRPALLAMMIDLSVPPLGVFFLATIAVNLLAAFLASGGLLVWLTYLAGFSFLLFAVSIAICWHRYGRDIVSIRDMAFAPIYALSKLPMLWRYLTKRQVAWVRADRDQN
jgi:glycosyltransferase involved in cell wall biosynthesis